MNKWVAVWALIVLLVLTWLTVIVITRRQAALAAEAKLLVFQKEVDQLHSQVEQIGQMVKSFQEVNQALDGLTNSLEKMPAVTPQ